MVCDRSDKSDRRIKSVWDMSLLSLVSQHGERDDEYIYKDGGGLDSSEQHPGG
jgi:hypothetical protein